MNLYKTLDIQPKHFHYSMEEYPKEIHQLIVDFMDTENELPEAVLSMCNLYYLTLKNYPHNYEISAAIGKLEKLKSLSFFPKIPVTKIPRPILNLSLTALEVVGLNVKQAIAFPKLEILHMHTSNSISAIQKLAGHLPHLKKLEITPINENPIGFPPEIKQFTKLEHLVLNGFFANFPKEFDEMVHLKHLTLDINATFDLTDEVISDFKRFETFEVRTATITKFSESFGEWKKLKNLRLSMGYNPYLKGRYAGNKVNHVVPVPIPKYFSELENLEELDLSNCGLSDVSVLGHLKKLKKLNLSWIENTMFGGTGTTVDYVPLSELTNLKELNLEMTRFETPELLNAPNLKSLNLNKCYEIRDFSFLKRMPRLEVLELEGCDFNEDVVMELNSTETLHELVELRELNIKGRNIGTINFILNMPFLEELNIEMCHNIKDVSPILEHPNLKKLRANQVVMKLWEKKRKI